MEKCFFSCLKSLVKISYYLLPGQHSWLWFQLQATQTWNATCPQKKSAVNSQVSSYFSMPVLPTNWKLWLIFFASRYMLWMKFSWYMYTQSVQILFFPCLSKCFLRDSSENLNEDFTIRKIQPKVLVNPFKDFITRCHHCLI